MPSILSEVMFGAYQEPRDPPPSALLPASARNRCRGVWQVLQCSNARVENCEFVNSSGFQLNTCIAPWYEAAPASNVAVVNNRFINCARNGMRKIPAVISITAEGPLPDVKDLATQGALVDRPVHRNVEITGNVIDGSSHGGMIFASVANLTIRNNEIRNVSRDTRVKPWRLTERKWDEYAVTFACGLENVVFEGNRFADTGAAEKKGVIALGETLPDGAVVIRDNVGFQVEKHDLFPERKR